MHLADPFILADLHRLHFYVEPIHAAGKFLLKAVQVTQGSNDCTPSWESNQKSLSFDPSFLTLITMLPPWQRTRGEQEKSAGERLAYFMSLA